MNSEYACILIITTESPALSAILNAVTSARHCLVNVSLVSKRMTRRARRCREDMRTSAAGRVPRYPPRCDRVRSALALQRAAMHHAKATAPRRASRCHVYTIICFASVPPLPSSLSRLSQIKPPRCARGQQSTDGNRWWNLRQNYGRSILPGITRHFGAAKLAPHELVVVVVPRASEAPHAAMTVLGIVVDAKGAAATERTAR